MKDETITLPLADVSALVKLAQEQTRYIEATDTSATGSIYGIEYADKTIARVAVRLPASNARAGAKPDCRHCRGRGFVVYTAGGDTRTDECGCIGAAHPSETSA